MRPTSGRGGRKEEIVSEDRDWSWRRDDILTSLSMAATCLDIAQRVGLDCERSKLVR